MLDNINWYPGHMAKATRLIKDNLSKVDLVVELCDTRIPESSRNPVLAKMSKRMPHILFMNKADLADPQITKIWVDHYESHGLNALPGNAFEKKDRNALIELANTLLADKQARRAKRGLVAQPIRLMMIGIPNSGKSTLINALAGRKAAQTEDRPGVTRGAQWIRTDRGYDLLDMPGVLWPRLGSRHNQIALACTGAIRDQVLDIEEVAFEALRLVTELYPLEFSKRFKIEDLDQEPYEIYLQAALRRGCVRSGGKPDTVRFAALFLDELRGGKIGKMTLDRPDRDLIEEER